MITKINIDGTRLNSFARREKMTRVAQEMHTVINSKIFQDEILKMKPFKGERSKFKDASNGVIYKMIMEGAEVLDPTVDHELDIYLDDYYAFSSAIGKTSGGSKWIYVNTRYFDSMHSKKVGSLCLHEYGHKLGFSHDFRATTDRPSSICYQLNVAYDNAYDKIFGVNQPCRVKVCKRYWFFWKKCVWEERTCKN